ncbi:trigger factor [Parvularcula sp. ZS-1/3]|uniref:Trigger factor n=1 Tax=Parvularcula mediterranea TaxID=2732508 RepID=A0A7Y3RJY2_9PROT|nr:trigger factor [Parvularcula mediterranea]NNU15467.1 trigger factor [Parvularcula mediterranea]
MQVTETKNEGLSREYNVVIPQAHLSERLNAKLEEIKPQVHLKGFRPGKAPTSFLKKLYGKNLMGELIQEEMQAAQAEALKDVQPAMQPHPHMKDGLLDEVVDGKADLEYHMHVEVLPEIEPQGLDAIKLEKMVAEIADEEIEEELKQLADQNKTYKDLPKNRNVKDGHKVTIDFKGKVDGEYFEGGSGEAAELVIGSGQFIPGFEEQLVGAKKDEEKVITVTFPEDYQAAHLAGKEAEFEVTIKANQEPQDAEINDDLAKQLGMDDLDALKARVKEMIQGRYDSQSRLHMKRELLDYLDEKHDFDLPPGMVKAEFEQIWQQVQSAELDEEDKEKSEDDLKADYEKIAARRVRLGLLLAEIGKESNVDVPQDELTRSIQMQAMQMGMQPQQLFQMIQERPELLAQFRAPLFEEKVVDHLIEKADVTEKTVSKDELMAEPGDE